MNVFSFVAEVNGQLVNGIIPFVSSFVIIIDNFVRMGLRVHHQQTLRDGHVEFLGSQLDGFLHLTCEERLLGLRLMILRGRRLRSAATQASWLAAFSAVSEIIPKRCCDSTLPLTSFDVPGIAAFLNPTQNI